MISHPSYDVEPWCLRETHLHLDLLAQSESVFALSNGHIGWRANLDEPHGLPGSYLNGMHEQRPLPYAEAGFGYSEAGQVMINVTNGKVIRLLVDDEPFDVRYGELHHHERNLDLRAGVLHRHARWSSPAGRSVALRSTRLVSLVQRSIAAICYEVEALDHPVRLVVQSDLVANEQLPPPSADPRVSEVLEAPLHAVQHACQGTRVDLVHRSARSALLMAAAMDHLIEGPASIPLTEFGHPASGNTSPTRQHYRHRVPNPRPIRPPTSRISLS